MDIEEAKAERTQLEMVIALIVHDYNKKTGAWVTEIRVTYPFSITPDVADINIEVKI